MEIHIYINCLVQIFTMPMKEIILNAQYENIRWYKINCLVVQLRQDSCTVRLQCKVGLIWMSGVPGWCPFALLNR